MKAIFLTAAQLTKLVEVAKDAFPNESCAFLLGHNDRVAKILPMRNIDESPVTFSIEPTDLIYNLSNTSTTTYY